MKFVLKLLILVSAVSLLAIILIDKYNVDLFFSQIGEERTVNNQEEYIIELRTGMLNREETIQLKFKGTSVEVNDFVGHALEEVLDRKSVV